MANRNFANGGKIFQMHAKPVIIDVQVTIGATGAVSSFTSSSTGANSMISSITKSATGTYQVTLADSYTSLLGIISGSARVASGTSGFNDIEQVGAMATITTGQQPQSQFSFQTVLAGTVANPNSGAVLQLIFLLNDSTAV